jgi:hypothetical protein
MIFATILSLTTLGQVVLPGNNLSLEQAKEKAHIIVVGKITRMGAVAGVGAAALGSFDLEHSEVLKGEVRGRALRALGFIAIRFEVSPVQDEEYLVFVEQYKDHAEVVKMLPKTKENVEAAKMVIKAKDKKKP